MVKISPEQAVFTAVRQACVATGFTTYDYLPTNEVAYPFIYVAEQVSAEERNNKDRPDSAIQQTVHIYHNNYRQRGTTSKLMEDIYKNVSSLKQISGRRFSMSKNQQVIPDTTTSTPLQHGIMDFEITLN